MGLCVKRRLRGAICIADGIASPDPPAVIASSADAHKPFKYSRFPFSTFPVDPSLLPVRPDRKTSAQYFNVTRTGGNSGGAKVREKADPRAPSNWIISAGQSFLFVSVPL